MLITVKASTVKRTVRQFNLCFVSNKFAKDC